MFCPKCSAENPVEARFCRNCGSAIEAQPKAPVHSVADSARKQPRIGLIVAVTLGVVILLSGGLLALIFLANSHTGGNNTSSDQALQTPVVPSPSVASDPMPVQPANFTAVSDTLYTQKILGSWRVRRALNTELSLDITGTYTPDGRVVWSGAIFTAYGQSRVELAGIWQVKDGNFWFRVDSSNIPLIIANGYTSTSKIIVLNDDQWTYVDAMDGDTETAYRVR